MIILTILMVSLVELIAMLTLVFPALENWHSLLYRLYSDEEIWKLDAIKVPPFYPIGYVYEDMLYDGRVFG